MGKLKTLSGHEVCKILECHGYKEIGRKGSHVSMRTTQDSASITVAVTMCKEVSKGVLCLIIRTSKLPRELFEIKK